MAKWQCNSCAETEGGNCPCVYENPMVDLVKEEDILCPISGEAAEFELVTDRPFKDIKHDKIT